MGSSSSTTVNNTYITNITSAVAAMAPRASLDEMAAHYEEHKKHANKRGGLYVDHYFRAKERTLSPDSSYLNPYVEWRRPYEVTDYPVFYKKAPYKTSAVVQGQLRDCWVVATLKALAEKYPEFLDQLVKGKKVLRRDPHDPEAYDGSAAFRFWHFGQWKIITVDDLLPMIVDPDTEELTCIYAHSEDRSEFWGALAEKAYAKLLGVSYHVLSWGYFTEALEDFTGCMANTIKLGNDTPINAFDMIQRATKAKSLVGASSRSAEFVPDNVTPLHAYIVEEATVVKGEQKITLSNTFGKSVHDRGILKLAFEDFIKYFDAAYICRFGDQMDSIFNDRYVYISEDGNWQSASVAVGWPGDQDSMAQNPQYLLTLAQRGPNEGLPIDTHIGLLQKDRKATGKKNMAIGLSIYKAPEGCTEPLTTETVGNMEAVASVDHVEDRTAYVNAQLDPGQYVIVPSTLYGNQEGSFMIRCFHDGDTSSEITKIGDWRGNFDTFKDKLKTEALDAFKEGLEAALEGMSNKL